MYTKELGYEMAASLRNSLVTPPRFKEWEALLFELFRGKSFPRRAPTMFVLPRQPNYRLTDGY
jgi:hypothetical protein